jgi:hypothetical protein
LKISEFSIGVFDYFIGFVRILGFSPAFYYPTLATDETDLCGFLPLETYALYGKVCLCIQFSAGFSAQALSLAPFKPI